MVQKQEHARTSGAGIFGKNDLIKKSAASVFLTSVPPWLLKLVDCVKSGGFFLQSPGQVPPVVRYYE